MVASVLAAVALLAQSVTPIMRGHAHNDYEHPRPLFEALDNGFTSIEADVFLRNGDLLVGHSESELKPERDLKRLYLAPLFARVQQNGGSVYPTKVEVILLVDIKEKGPDVYEELKRELEPYKDLLTSYDVAKGVSHKAVMVVLSGDRPSEVLKKEDQRMAFLDGTLKDLDPNPTDAQLFPLISDNWDDHFKWNGEGRIGLPDEAKLKLLVDRAHSQKQLIRFWGAPDVPNFWQTLLDDGVDLINTDKLAEFHAFMQTYRKKG